MIILVEFSKRTLAMLVNVLVAKETRKQLAAQLQLGMSDMR